MNQKKIIFLLIIFVSLTLPLGYASAQLPNLEIVYPRIPGDETPPTVISEGLPDYVNYIYYFFFAIIGIIVLGALIYNGIIYLTSVGSPDKLMSAKKGIVAAFLGAIILFSSWFVFQSINPQITVLEAENPNLIEPVITPGIYLCNYRVPNIDQLLSDYESSEETGTSEERIAAARGIKEIIKQGNNICFRVTFSGNLSFFFDPRAHTIFQIPKKIYINDEIRWWHIYGIIFHQKDNFRGRCAIGALYNLYDFTTDTPDQNSYFSRTGYVGLIRSVTLFEAPTDPLYVGIILYQCLDYNKTGQCPEGLSAPANRTFPGISPAGDATWIRQGSLENLASNNPGTDNLNGTRSIQIDQEGSYFAVLFSEDGYKGNTCEVIIEDDNNLLDQPIGQCEIRWDGRTCTGLMDWNEEEEYLRDCKPCTNSMIVVKGNVVK